METECSWRRKREAGEILAEVLYWAGWCVLAASVCCVLLAILYTQDWPEKGRWQIVMLYARAMVQGIFGALVLFGISAIVRATNANTREIRKLVSKEGQQG